jgi:hypothetical protein
VNLPVKFLKTFWTKKLALVLPPSICFVLVLFSTSLFPRWSFIPGVFGCSRVMAADSTCDLESVGRCTPYSTRASSPRDVEPRILDYPHLTLLLVNEEHLRAILPGEQLVNSPPRESPLHAWLSTGDPEAYCGPLIISWVFFRDMILRDEEGRYTYNPLFFARVVSQGHSPFVVQMTSAWHERANTTMALPARDRSVHHIPGRLVPAFLQARGHYDHRPFSGWDFELLTMEVILHPHCLRASRRLLGGALLGSTTSLDLSRQDFGTPPSIGLRGR